MKNSKTVISLFQLLLILTIGTVFVFACGRETKLICARNSAPSPQCSLQEYGIFEIQSNSIVPLSEIEKIDLESIDEEDDANAKLFLITKTSKIPVGGYGDYDEKNNLAEQLGWFLETPTATYFSWNQGNRTFSWLLLGLMLCSTLLYLKQQFTSTRRWR